MKWDIRQHCNTVTFYRYKIHIKINDRDFKRSPLRTLNTISLYIGSCMEMLSRLRVIYSCETKLHLLRRKGFDCTVSKRKRMEQSIYRSALFIIAAKARKEFIIRRRENAFQLQRKKFDENVIKTWGAVLLFHRQRGAQSSHNFVNSFRSQSSILRAKLVLKNVAVKFSNFSFSFSGYCGNHATSH